MRDQDSSADSPDSPAPWWMRALKRIAITALILVTILACFIAYLAWDISRYDEVNSPPMFDGVMDNTPITEARTQTIDLLLAIYQALENQAGLGPWEPVTNDYQIQGADLICSPTGEGTNEEYRLATAPGTITLDQANTIISQVAEPHGFATHEDFKDAFTRHSDGAEIWLTGRDSGQTIVNITTGCHPGTIYQDWPTGTENIPTHLRGIGRRHHDHETWSPHEPTNPTPSP
ncbi:hypothetical protein, partial [Actinomyces bowdenii]